MTQRRAVGAQQSMRLVGVCVNSEAVDMAVKEIMPGEKAEETRSRANSFGILRVWQGKLLKMEAHLTMILVQWILRVI